MARNCRALLPLSCHPSLVACLSCSRPFTYYVQRTHTPRHSGLSRLCSSRTTTGTACSGHQEAIAADRPRSLVHSNVDVHKTFVHYIPTYPRRTIRSSPWLICIAWGRER